MGSSLKAQSSGQERIERDGNLKAGVEEQSAGKGPRQGGRERNWWSGGEGRQRA